MTYDNSIAPGHEPIHAFTPSPKKTQQEEYDEFYFQACAQHNPTAKNPYRDPITGGRPGGESSTIIEDKLKKIFPTAFGK